MEASRNSSEGYTRVGFISDRSPLLHGLRVSEAGDTAGLGALGIPQRRYDI